MSNNRRRLAAVCIGGLLGVVVFVAQAIGQTETASEFGQASSTQNLLAQMVQKAAVIFAGGVYAVETPKDKPGEVDVYLRVDQSIRGADTSKGFILRLPQSESPQFHTGDHFVLLLGSPDPSGMSRPVGGSLGILPVDDKFNVDLSRLHSSVRPAATGKAAEPANGGSPGKTNDATERQPANSPAAPGQSASAPSASDSPLTAITGNQMPELEQPKASFLAVLRDLFVLAADQSQQPQGKPQQAPENHSGAQPGPA